MYLKFGVINSNVSPRSGLNGLVVFFSITVRSVVEYTAIKANLLIGSC